MITKKMEKQLVDTEIETRKSRDIQIDNDSKK